MVELNDLLEVFSKLNGSVRSGWCSAMGSITCHPSVDYFPGLCSSTESHISMAKHINPGIFPFGNTIRKHMKGTWRKNFILLFIAPLKMILPLAGSFCCHILPHVYLRLLGGHGFSEMSSQGKGCKNGCKSIRMEEKGDLLSCALDFPAVSQQLISWVHGCVRANNDSANVQIQQELYNPEATE